MVPDSNCCSVRFITTIDNTCLHCNIPVTNIRLYCTDDMFQVGMSRSAVSSENKFPQRTLSFLAMGPTERHALLLQPQHKLARQNVNGFDISPQFCDSCSLGPLLLAATLIPSSRLVEPPWPTRNTPRPPSCTQGRLRQGLWHSHICGIRRLITDLSKWHDHVYADRLHTLDRLVSTGALCSGDPLDVPKTPHRSRTSWLLSVDWTCTGVRH